MADITIDKLPQKIKDAADHLFKAAKWTSATKNKEDGEDIYELFGDEKGASLSMEITGDAKVTSVEHEVDVKSLPKAVTEAISSKMPKFKIEDALAMYSGDDIRDLSKAELIYALSGEGAKGKDLEVEITADGKILEVKREIEVSDLPKAVANAVAAKFPKFKIETAHSVRREGDIISYLLVGASGRIVTASPDGKELEIHRDE